MIGRPVWVYNHIQIGHGVSEHAFALFRARRWWCFVQVYICSWGKLLVHSRLEWSYLGIPSPESLRLYVTAESYVLGKRVPLTLISRIVNTLKARFFSYCQGDWYMHLVVNLLYSHRPSTTPIAVDKRNAMVSLDTKWGNACECVV
jgi:hypothetical protein